MSETKACTKCGQVKPMTLEHFQAKKEMTCGFNSWCRDCIRASARVRQAKRRADPVQRERVMDEKRRHLQSPRGREWKRSASLIENNIRRQRGRPGEYLWSLALWLQAVADFGGRCAYCDGDKKLSQDHFIPLAAPNCPGTVPWNIVPACRSCNASKASRPAEQWVKDSVRLARIVAYLESRRVSQQEIAA